MVAATAADRIGLAQRSVIALDLQLGACTELASNAANLKVALYRGACCYKYMDSRIYLES